jgi:SH3 domain protein
MLSYQNEEVQSDMKRALLVLLVLTIVVGCGPVPTPEPTATPTPTPPLPPTDTPMPTDTPVPTPVPSPTSIPQPEAVVAVDLLNLRAGPGTNYDILTMMEEGTRLKMVGRTEANDWLKVVTADGREGWVFAEMVNVSGDLGAIAVAQAPATPTPLPSPTPEAPTATAEPPTPTPKPGILLEDDFSDPASGWPERSNGDEWWYENGEFHGLVKGPHYLTWLGYPGKVFSDFVLEADTRKVDGPNGAGYGLACCPLP